MNKKMTTAAVMAVLLFTNLSAFALNVSSSEDLSVNGTTLKIQVVEKNFVDEFEADEKFVRMSKKDFNALKRQAALTNTVLKRLRQVEKLVKKFEGILTSTTSTINGIKSFLKNTFGWDLGGSDDSSSGDTVDDVSGARLNPGKITFKVETTNKNEFFSDLDIKNLEFDLEFEVDKFAISSIDGKDVDGERYKTIPLSKTQRSSKKRVRLPLIDTDINSTTFTVNFGPANPRKTKVGDDSDVDIIYYKRLPKNPDGTYKEAPIKYDYASGSKKYIKVVVESVYNN